MVGAAQVALVQPHKSSMELSVVRHSQEMIRKTVLLASLDGIKHISCGYVKDVISHHRC